ncbi:fasciclin-like arabinogalactan protein 7 [Bidens hawaiensis]|uniref:fasciclin-like arabinogalactan protein 7 n=1 Tax=Bidens hawaiensis TaxID=980011 RepID=UPI00404A8076
MGSTKILFICFTVLMFTYSQSETLPKSPPTILPPTPAPAPAPDYVNLTELLSVAGPFSNFLKLLEQTKVIETLQNQANNTGEGITLFVPKDKAFTSLKKPSLSNLTADELKQLCLFHALPHYYSLSDFKNLSSAGPVNTLAGGTYTLNFTDDSGTVHIGSGWTNTVVSSSVHSTDPVAIYQVNKVLLPEAIFGTDIPAPVPAPAPAPVPDVAPVADAPDADAGKGPAAKASAPSASHRISWWSVWRCLMVVVVSGGFVVVL